MIRPLRESIWINPATATMKTVRISRSRWKVRRRSRGCRVHQSCPHQLQSSVMRRPVATTELGRASSPPLLLSALRALGNTPDGIRWACRLPLNMVPALQNPPPSDRRPQTCSLRLLSRTQLSSRRQVPLIEAPIVSSLLTMTRSCTGVF